MLAITLKNCRWREIIEHKNTCAQNIWQGDVGCCYGVQWFWFTFTIEFILSLALASAFCTIVVSRF
jgi:hypothetical protein